ncbi:hypothetical protein [Paracoccus sp. T5]|uniref:hypothetical protein n=1 Tax=Paracoccus sp. T5 TaxID=3402161 RepID=UPI003ADFC855
MEILDNVTQVKIPASHFGARLGSISGRFALLINGTSGTQAEQSLNNILRTLDRAHFPSPNMLLLVGVAWGNPNKISICDVILSAEVIAANHQRIKAGEAERRTSRFYSKAGPVLELVEQLKTKGLLFDVKSGPLLSAELHLGDSEARDEFLKSAPDAVGGDMEAHSIVQNIGQPWLIIKGISDFADDATNRFRQPHAAKNAALLLPDLLNCLVDFDIIKDSQSDILTYLALQAISGRSISIHRDDYTLKGMNNYLNDDIGPDLLFRLKRYAPDGNISERMAAHLTDVILELVQNTLRHAGASDVSIDFEGVSIVIVDNGHPFDPRSLTASSGNGGSRAWEVFTRAYTEKKLIDFTYYPGTGKKPNRTKFVICGLTEQLREARKNCAISLDYRPDFYGAPKLTFDEKCTTLYFDTSQVLMMSRRIGFWSELKVLLAEGKSIYLSCRNLEEVREYQLELNANEFDNLWIFVGGS